MPNLLFWNIRKGSALPFLQAACLSYHVDILVLSEADKVDVVQSLNSGQSARVYQESSFVSVPTAHNVRFFSIYQPSQFRVVGDFFRCAARHVVLASGLEFLLFGVHLPSKLSASNDEQYHVARSTISIVKEEEKKIGHKKSIIIGDFNMAPFEHGMVAHDGFHAMMDREVSKKGQRIYKSVSSDFFYNPMWSYLGDASLGPSGTHFYDNSDLVNLYWNSFDQVLIRPDLLQNYKGFEVVTNVGSTNLLATSGRLDHTISDHLPILVRM